jgi:hypothetical protein
MSMPPVYAICPGNTVTGGPEVLHQLVRAIRDAGRPAFMVYHPFESAFEVPEAYAKYGVESVRREEIRPGADIVLPEMYPTLPRTFPGCRINFWWLSVDNFRFFLIDRRHRARLPGRVSAVLEPLIQPLTISRLRRDVDRHLYQSEYARRFLEAQRLAPADHLGDYINADYLQAIADPPRVPREDIVAYNPAKGAERTQPVLRALETLAGDRIRAIPITNMPRTEVRNLLARAKVYIDFGHHPGKDRIPREAAAMGACVLLNRRGSADNPIDVGLPDFFRVDDRAVGFEAVAAGKILTIVDAFEAHQRQFDDYRTTIAAEPERFQEDARRIFLS